MNNFKIISHLIYFITNKNFYSKIFVHSIFIPYICTRIRSKTSTFKSTMKTKLNRM